MGPNAEVSTGRWEVDFHLAACVPVPRRGRALGRWCMWIWAYAGRTGSACLSSSRRSGVFCEVFFSARDRLRSQIFVKGVGLGDPFPVLPPRLDPI